MVCRELTYPERSFTSAAFASGRSSEISISYSDFYRGCLVCVHRYLSAMDVVTDPAEL